MCFQEETLLLFFLFLFPCNIHTITLSFKKKLSLRHRGKCQSNTGIFSHFQALQQRTSSLKITGYEKKSQFITVVREVKSEVLLGLLFCCAFHYFRVL